MLPLPLRLGGGCRSSVIAGVRCPGTTPPVALPSDACLFDRTACLSYLTSWRADSLVVVSTRWGRAVLLGRV